jgi:hypothetical protein
MYVTVGVAILAVASSAFSVQTYRTATTLQRTVNATQLTLNAQSCHVRRDLTTGQVANLTNLVATANVFRSISVFTPADRAFFEKSFQTRTAALAKAKSDLASLKC